MDSISITYALLDPLMTVARPVVAFVTAFVAGLSENETVRMTSPYGTVRLPLKLDVSMKPGYLFAPIHFSDPNFNSLMSAVPIDPKARMPALKVIPVKVERDS